MYEINQDSDSAKIDGKWETIDDFLYEKRTGIGDKEVGRYCFNSIGQFAYENYILREQDKKGLVKGDFIVDSESKLLFLKFLKIENSANKSCKQIIMSVPFETVLQYRFIENDSTHGWFKGVNLEIKYLPISDLDTKNFSISDLKTLKWNTERREIISLLEKYGNTVQMIKEKY
ncbi:hypothetical protein WSM22_47180 [Cytophagales bacterium WSM2-2]|nr:hypothetical protein WSM22_47180 [Cytophagales bacterium WSM2-2]